MMKRPLISSRLRTSMAKLKFSKIKRPHRSTLHQGVHDAIYDEQWRQLSPLPPPDRKPPYKRRVHKPQAPEPPPGSRLVYDPILNKMVWRIDPS